jgi:prepilin-type N-terminal cleavage/methylation domain-containing protein
MAAARKKPIGFTLVELLITIAIFSLVVTLATFSFQLIARDHGRRLDGFSNALSQTHRLHLVDVVLRDALPWGVRDSDGKPGFYFLGRRTGMTFVTDSPVFGVGSAAVVRLFTEQREGRWNLVYEEASLEGIQLTDADQELPFKNRLIVLHGADEITFRYYGWETLSGRFGDTEDSSSVANQPRWFDEFDGLVTLQSPQRVELLIDQSRFEYLLSDRVDITLDRLGVGE